MLSRGGLLVLCFRSFAFTVAPKALPCVGCCYPLHVWGVATLYTTLERCRVALRCRTEVFIIDVPGPPLDVH